MPLHIIATTDNSGKTFHHGDLISLKCPTFTEPPSHPSTTQSGHATRTCVPSLLDHNNAEVTAPLVRLQNQRAFLPSGPVRMLCKPDSLRASGIDDLQFVPDQSVQGTA